MTIKLKINLKELNPKIWKEGKDNSKNGARSSMWNLDDEIPLNIIDINRIKHKISVNKISPYKSIGDKIGAMMIIYLFN